MAALLRYSVPVQWAGIYKIFLFNKHKLLKYSILFLAYCCRETVFMRGDTPREFSGSIFCFSFLPLPFLSSFPILIFHLPVFLICPSFSFQYPFFTFLPLKKPFYFFTFLPLKTLFTFKRAFFRNYLVSPSFFRNFAARK